MRKKELFWGLLFILAAVLIILNQFGFLGNIDNMYQIVAAVVLGGIMIKSALNLNFWGILFPAAFICIIFANEWNITKFTPWPALLTALLCSIGLSMIFKRPHGWGHHHFHHHDNMFGSKIVNEKDDDIISCSTSFGECMKYVNSNNFQKADIKCSFGSAKVYFDNAQIPSGKADIYLDVSFGEAQLYIPKDWKVINKVHIFLGDMESNNRNISSDSPEVTIHGNISFGDAKVFFV